MHLAHFKTATWRLFFPYLVRNGRRSLCTTAMASIFANALRTQARVAFVGSRAVLPSTATFRALVSRQSIPSFYVRSLSTTQVIRADFDNNEFGRPSQPGNTLYLGNLPYSIEERELQELLSGFGNIKAIRMGRFFFFLSFSLYLFSNLIILLMRSI